MDLPKYPTKIAVVLGLFDIIGRRLDKMVNWENISQFDAESALGEDLPIILPKLTLGL
jgi:hypothetical protein